MVRSCPDVVNEPFAYVVSFGSRCVAARHLRDQGLRVFAGPWDWVYSNVPMLRHCLKDNFTKFLDPACLVSAGKAWGHTQYGEMLGRKVVFPHHRPKEEDDRRYFLRATERLRLVFASPKRKLFVCVQLIKSRKALESQSDSNNELQKLFQDLKRYPVKNFELLAIFVIESSARDRQDGAAEGDLPSISVLKDIGSRERLVLQQLHCKGSCTGLFFKAEADEHALSSIIKGEADRIFSLEQDPLPQDSSGSYSRLRLMGEVLPTSQAATASSSSSRKRKRSEENQSTLASRAQENDHCPDTSNEELKGSSDDMLDDLRVLNQIAEMSSNDTVDVEMLLEQLATEAEDQLAREISQARKDAAEERDKLKHTFAEESDRESVEKALQASVLVFENEARQRAEAASSAKVLEALQKFDQARVAAQQGQESCITSNQLLVKQLEELGFTSEQMAKAVLQRSTLQGCVEWILDSS